MDKMPVDKIAREDKMPLIFGAGRTMCQSYILNILLFLSFGIIILFQHTK